MKINAWKKLSALILCLSLPCTVCAETISADVLNEANSLSALRKTYISLLVDEFSQTEDIAEQQTFWDGTTADGRSLQVILQSESQREIFVLDGIFYEYDMTQGTLFCCAWLPDSQEAFAANWDTQLQLFADDTFFTSGEGNTASAELLTVERGGTIRESWNVDAKTYALQGYTCEASLTDENGENITESYTLSVVYNAACLLPDDMLNQLSGETFTLTLVNEQGNKTQQQLPIDLPIHFTDGFERLLFFRDPAFENPVDTLYPAAENMTGGVTLYYSSEAE